MTLLLHLPGPSLIDVWMKSSGDTRKIAVSSFLNLWLVSGLMLCSACFSITRDEERMKQGLKKIAMAAVSDLHDSRTSDRDSVRASLIESGRPA